MKFIQKWKWIVLISQTGPYCGLAITYHGLPPPYSKLKIIPLAQEKGLLVLSKSDLYVSENSR